MAGAGATREWLMPGAPQRCPARRGPPVACVEGRGRPSGQGRGAVPRGGILVLEGLALRVEPPLGCLVGAVQGPTRGRGLATPQGARLGRGRCTQHGEGRPPGAWVWGLWVRGSALTVVSGW